VPTTVDNAAPPIPLLRSSLYEDTVVPPCSTDAFQVTVMLVAVWDRLRSAVGAAGQVENWTAVPKSPWPLALMARTANAYVRPPSKPETIPVVAVVMVVKPVIDVLVSVASPLLRYTM
jgi:hypothetical protein